MKYLAAYMLAVLGGNASPDSKDILRILDSVGLDVDMEDAKKIVNALSGKNVNEVMKAGLSKLASVPSGGGAPAAAAPAAVSSSPAAETKQEAKKEEEPKEESDEDMGFGLFD